jgi:peroxiredoxin Q/BCP
MLGLASAPALALASFVAGVALAGSAAAQGAPAAAGSDLKVGDPAPDFTLQATDGKTYTLSKDLRGKWLVLAWFPKAFTAG